MYQFSLRQLMLWTAVVALSLGVMKVLGLEACSSSLLVGCFVVVGAIRVSFGPDVACLACGIVALILGIGLAVGGFVGIVADAATGNMSAGTVAMSLIFVALAVVVSCGLGVIVFAFVEIVFRAVQWLDRAMEKK